MKANQPLGVWSAQCRFQRQRGRPQLERFRRSRRNRVIQRPQPRMPMLRRRLNKNNAFGRRKTPRSAPVRPLHPFRTGIGPSASRSNHTPMAVAVRDRRASHSRRESASPTVEAVWCSATPASKRSELERGRRRRCSCPISAKGARGDLGRLGSFLRQNESTTAGGSRRSASSTFDSPKRVGAVDQGRRQEPACFRPGASIVWLVPALQRGGEPKGSPGSRGSTCDWRRRSESGMARPPMDPKSPFKAPFLRKNPQTRHFKMAQTPNRPVQPDRHTSGPPPPTDFKTVAPLASLLSSWRRAPRAGGTRRPSIGAQMSVRTGNPIPLRGAGGWRGGMRGLRLRSARL